MSSHLYSSEFATRERKYPLFNICELAFACLFGLGLGLLMGWQFHIQTSPADEVARQVNSNTVKIAQIEAWIAKYGVIVIRPEEGRIK